MTPADLCAKYPYVPGSNAWDYPHGSPERLRGIPPEGGLREALASFYLACEPRWLEAEVRKRAGELKRKAALTLPQSREHLEHWNGGDR